MIKEARGLVRHIKTLECDYLALEDSMRGKLLEFQMLSASPIHTHPMRCSASPS